MFVSKALQVTDFCQNNFFTEKEERCKFMFNKNLFVICVYPFTN